ncbi:MAG: hypothetical protein IH960_13690, partial [Chloroflexi bacterium]|nr:hypothetical protein [Chloroflexota bacterium]
IGLLAAILGTAPAVIAQEGTGGAAEVLGEGFSKRLGTFNKKMKKGKPTNFEIKNAGIRERAKHFLAIERKSQSKNTTAWTPAISLVAGLLVWLPASLRWVPFTRGSIGLAMLLLTAAALYAIGMLHLHREKLKFYAGPYLISGALLAIAMTYMLTFDDVFRGLLGERVVDPQAVTGQYLVLAAIVSGISVAAIVMAVRNPAYAGKTLVSRFAEPGVIALVVGFGWLIATLPFGSPEPYVIGFNLLLVLLIFGSIVLGIVNRREALVNVGIVFFVIDVSTRYLELAWDLLDTSLAFIVGGLLLLGTGYAMERARRRLLRQFGMMEVSHDS